MAAQQHHTDDGKVVSEGSTAVVPRAASGRPSLWARITLYFPALLMLLLTLGTAWLMHSTPEVAQTEVSAADNSRQQEIDYFMRDYALRAFDRQGRLSRSLQGDRFEVRSDDQSQWAQEVVFAVRNRDGSWLVAQARTGSRSADGQMTALSGGAHVQHLSADRQSVLTDVYSERVEVDEAGQRVRLLEGVKLVKDGYTLHSNRGELLADAEKLRLDGNVRAAIRRR